jgi:hypothetical protein
MIAFSASRASRVEPHHTDYTSDSASIARTIDTWLGSAPSSAELWQYAIEYRRLGWNVVPVRGKVPVIPWKELQCERLPEYRLQALLNIRGVTGIAALAGWISGHKATAILPTRKLAVRDFDTVQAFQIWASKYPHLATTLPRVRTRRGYHVYCWSPYEVFEKFRDGELKAKSDSQPIIVLPPSLHPEGHIYRWEIPLPLHPDSLPIIDPKEIFLHSDYQTKLVSHKPCIKRRGWSKLVRSKSIAQESDGVTSVEESKLSPEDWQSIWVTLPETEGQRNDQILALARRLKGMAHLTDAPVEAVQGIVRIWHRKALPTINTKEWEQTWKDFKRAWKRVQFPIGQDPIHELIRVAAGTETPEESRYQQPEVRCLVRVCRALQTACEIRGSDRFYVSCRTAAVECGFTGEHGFRTAARWLKRLVKDGVLELVKAGIGGTSCRLASEYRFRGLCLQPAKRRAA